MQGAGLDLRGPIFGIYNYPTIVIFAEGRGIANARALIEAGPEERGLSFELRQDVRLYYRVRRTLKLASQHFGCAIGCALTSRTLQ